MFFSPRRDVSAAGWAGAWIDGGCATSLGIGALYTKAQDAAKPSMPGSEVDRTPKEIAPFRPISDGRTPKKQAPAHLAASAISACAKRKTQNYFFGNAYAIT